MRDRNYVRYSVMSKNTLYRIEYRKEGETSYITYFRVFDVADIIYEASKHAARFNETYVITEAII